MKKIVLIMGYTMLPLHAFSSTATNILMVRHAETFRNAEGQEIQGWIDDDKAQLNERGRNQAEALGKKMAAHYPGLTTIYSSNAGRCLETAERVANRFPDVIAVQREPRFREICHGQHDTMSYKGRNEYCLGKYKELEDEFKKDFPDETPGRFFYWSVNPLAERAIPLERQQNPLREVGDCPETILDVFKRATEALGDIEKAHPGETVLISSHAAVISTLADEAESREDPSPIPVYYGPKKEGSKQLPGNCVVYHFVRENGVTTFLGTEDLLSAD